MIGFPFQQSIRNSASSGRFEFLSANIRGKDVNANAKNARRIPQLGCLEEGKDEDGQSGVGEDDDLELGIAS